MLPVPQEDLSSLRFRLFLCLSSLSRLFGLVPGPCSLLLLFDQEALGQQVSQDCLRLRAAATEAAAAERSADEVDTCFVIGVGAAGELGPCAITGARVAEVTSGARATHARTGVGAVSVTEKSDAAHSISGAGAAKVTASVGATCFPVRRLLPCETGASTVCFMMRSASMACGTGVSICSMVRSDLRSWGEDDLDRLGLGIDAARPVCAVVRRRRDNAPDGELLVLRRL